MELVLTVYRTIMGGLFGLVIGSFMNVLIYRLPRHESAARGRSHCTHCQHPLSGRDLVPVISFLLLQGRCRYCQQPIAARYMIVELITGLFFAATLAFWGSGPFAPTTGTRIVWLAELPDFYLNGILIILYLSLFCGLLIMSFIAADKQRPPAGLYVWVGIPFLLRLLLQSDRLWLHLAGALLAGGLWLFVMRFILNADQDEKTKSVEWITLSLVGLATGLWAVQPACAVVLILVFRSQTQTDLNTARAKRSQTLRDHVLPFACVIAFLSGLFF